MASSRPSFAGFAERPDRRAFLRACGTGAMFMAMGCRAPGSSAAPMARPGGLTNAEILARVNAARPLRGGLIPADLGAGRLGTAHVSGRYFHSTKPFLVEGAEAVHGLGMQAIKLWMANVPKAYPHHSDWNLGEHASLLEIIQHPYFRAALELPFQVVALEVQEALGPQWRKVTGHSINPDSDFAEDERQVRELCVHLLRTYGDRGITFLLQNWEGDWMYRGSAREEWRRGEFPERERRAAAFQRWFAARQRGVDAARAEVGPTRSKVLHAIEVNRVFDLEKGLATLTTDVLPQVEVDLISWSCYDGLRLEDRSGESAALGLWRGLDHLQAHAQTRLTMPGGPAVYFGEIGVPEQVISEMVTVDVMDAAMGVAFAREVPYILHWEIYCNERIAAASQLPAPNRAEDLRGYWLIRPDGSLGFTGEYFRQLLTHAGGRLPAGQ